MANTISFLQAVRTGLIQEGDRVNITPCFPSEDKIITLTQEETGYKKEQTFTRGENLEWYYLRDSNGLNTLYTNAANYFRLYLSGIVGYANISLVLHKLASLYSNLKIGCIARPMNKEDGILLCSKNIPFKPDAVWLNSPYVLDTTGWSDFGTNLLYNSNLDYCHLFRSSGDSRSEVCGISLAISILTYDVWVDIESNQKYGEWELFSPETK